MLLFLPRTCNTQSVIAVQTAPPTQRCIGLGGGSRTHKRKRAESIIAGHRGIFKAAVLQKLRQRQPRHAKRRACKRNRPAHTARNMARAQTWSQLLKRCNGVEARNGNSFVAIASQALKFARQKCRRRICAHGQRKTHTARWHKGVRIIRMIQHCAELGQFAVARRFGSLTRTYTEQSCIRRAFQQKLLRRRGIAIKQHDGRLSNRPPPRKIRTRKRRLNATKLFLIRKAAPHEHNDFFFRRAQRGKSGRSLGKRLLKRAFECFFGKERRTLAQKAHNQTHHALGWSERLVLCVCRQIGGTYRASARDIGHANRASRRPRIRIRFAPLHGSFGRIETLLQRAAHRHGAL